MEKTASGKEQIWYGGYSLNRMQQGVARSEGGCFREGLSAGRGKKCDMTHFSF